MRGTGFLVLVSMMLASGSAGCVEPGIPPDSGGSAVSFARVESGPSTQYQTTDRQFLVLDTQPEWEDFWQRHVRPGGPGTPPVDFGERFILAMLLGERRTGGHEIQVTSILWDGSWYTVHHEERRPGQCPSTGALTYPFDVVSVTRVDTRTPEAVFPLAATVDRTC